MKEFIKIYLSIILIIILFPIIILSFLLYFLYVPFDIIRYHKTPYYKDLKKKYKIFATNYVIIKTYNKIKENKLDIQYHYNDNFEYFVKDNETLMCGWSELEINEIDGEWYFGCDDESDTDSHISVSEALECDEVHLKPEHKNMDKKHLIVYDNSYDSELLNKAKKCPYFKCIAYNM